MTNAVSESEGKASVGMVNEFQLGLYVYDAIYKNSDIAVEKKKSIDEGLGLNSLVENKDGDDVTVQEYFTDEAKGKGIIEIPYSVFVELGDVANLETNYSTGLTIADGKTAIYPRNLLWNRYLNTHSIFVISNGKREADYAVDGSVPAEKKDVTEPTNYYGGGFDDYKKYDKTAEPGKINYGSLTRFVSNSKFSVNPDARFLSDEKGNVIIGVRSKFGIHLMIVEKSAYDFDSKVKLEDYYTTLIPTDDGYPTVPAGEHTYVDLINTKSQSDYKSRADAVKSAIKGFDSTYDYRLYEELRSWDGIDATNEKNTKLFDAIQNYIDLQREKNQYTQKDGIEKVWKSYVDLLNTQDHYRTGLTGADCRIIPEGCKIAFTKTTLDMNDPDTQKLFKQGGYCYGK